MNLFNKVKNILNTGYQQLATKLQNQFAPHNISSSGSGGGVSAAPSVGGGSGSGSSARTFSMVYNPSRAYANIIARLTVTADKATMSSAMHTIGFAGVDEARRLVEPLRDQGNLSDAFDYKLTNNGMSVVIYNDYQSSTAVHDGIQGMPSFGVIRDWIDSKGFPTDPTKTTNENAFLIWRSIVTDLKTSKRSVIGRKEPVDIRAYAYMDDVEIELRKQVLPAFQQSIGGNP